MKIKAYFPQTFTLMADEVERLEESIRAKFDQPDIEISDEDLLIAANAEGLIVMPNASDFKT